MTKLNLVNQDPRSEGLWHLVTLNPSQPRQLEAPVTRIKGISRDLTVEKSVLLIHESEFCS